MSLPIYLKPLEKDIIEELQLQGADDDTIKSIVYDFRGRKREEELLKYLISNRNLTFSEIMSKKLEIKNTWDMFWGYIITEEGSEIYRPDLYVKWKKL